jgi:hypothetical protein
VELNEKGGRIMRPPFSFAWLGYFFLVAFLAAFLAGFFAAAFFVAICLFSLVSRHLSATDFIAANEGIVSEKISVKKNLCIRKVFFDATGGVEGVSEAVECRRRKQM